jgi:RimJ/RimL family protein N-acetyltransferase
MRYFKALRKHDGYLPSGPLDYAFTKKGLQSVVVIIKAEHIASMRVAEKVGFYVHKNIKFHERLVRLYRLNHDQWNASHKK